jgi:hypothetical protein
MGDEAGCAQNQPCAGEFQLALALSPAHICIPYIPLQRSILADGFEIAVISGVELWRGPTVQAFRLPVTVQPFSLGCHG